ncbi:hypothetical protein PR003_g1462 [Phytophthora rubi]|uniref:EGF-like domain-containing protein n=1 Tax=Phytophthora rubi TaxID=129364 RepID=A0A6A4G3F7_9STRA|nr:hypothetical protein PR003_g1462 [Phytophthora rubi]
MERRMLGIFVLLLLPVVVVQVADAACANSCSGHGRCGASNQCTCDADWALAPDCSLRKCPTGVAWTDKAKTANAAHAVAECSNRGVCDYSKGECTCFNGYTGAACQRLRCPSDCSGHGLCYSSATLASQYGPSSLAGSGPTYTNWEKDSMTSCMCDMGYNGPDCSQFMCAKNDDPLTTGQAYRTIQIAVRASRLLNTGFKLFEAMVGDTNTVVDIRGDGLTTIYTGGLSVVTGGGIIANTVDAPSLTVTNSFGTFSSSLLKLSTSRATQYPGASDFLLIEASANSVPAFTVEASGRTTISNGGLIVSGLGGGQISNSDTAASALVVSATSTSFVGDAVAIKTFSGSAHNMLKVTTRIAPAAPIDLFTIANSGLTTITQTGLYITSGGATVNAGGIHIINGGETIDFGGLRVKDGGGTIELGGLNVIDGGGTIATTAATTDVLTVEATATTFSSNARVLHINSKSTVLPATSMHYLLEATVGATSTSVFKVDATGLATIAGQGSGGASISDKGTTANTLMLTNSAASFNQKVLGMVATDTNGYSFIDATVGSTSVFNVDASGLTTIVGQGDGGASISDKGTTANTLTLTNSAASFNQKVLGMVATDTNGYSFIDATVGSTSVFNVDASGLTTIVGQGDGGASISDKGTTANTLTLTNSAASFNQKVLGMVATDTNGYSFIDATVGSTSVFNVDASGLTTIVGQGDGGASISDKGTTANTLTLTNSAASFNQKVLGMVATDTNGYSFIDATVGSTSVFNVDASGLTTIVGQGDGGASISDKGTTANTLTLTNSAASFNQKVLGMVATDTNGYSFIDATVGSTSVFNVDASGLTMIVGQGSGGASISDSSTSTTDTVTVANTAITGFSGALLAMSSTSSDKLYRFIDAQVASVSVFKVVASGLTTIAGQGSGGASISDKGTTANTLSVANSVTSGFTGALLSMNAVSSTTSYTLIDAKSSGTSRFKVVASGLTTISAGGLSVTGGVTVVDTGLTVTTGGASISDSSASNTNTLTVANSATSGFTGALLAMSSTSSTTGYSFIDGKVGSTSVFKVAGTGLATIAGQGSGGASVSDTGTTANTLTVANSVSTGFTGAVLSLNAVSSTTVYSLIDATVGAGSTPRFNVAATGLTTIVGSGSGGASISDSGTTTSTLSVANSVTSGFTGALLSMNAVSTTKLYTLIDAQSSGVSRFKVAATGLTTIVGSGGGGASISDAGTTTNTLIVANSISTGFTGTLLSMNAVSTTTSYTLIDAQSSGTSKFTVAASGLTTIASGGLTVTTGGVTIGAGGLVVSAGGATVTAGGLTVSAGGASISDNQATVNTLSVANSITSGFTGALLSMNAVSSTTSYTLIDAKSSGTSRFKVVASGLTTISAGGLSVTGGVTVVDTGLTVTTGGASISDSSASNTNTLTVANSATSGFTGALLAMSSTSSTTGYSFIDGKVGSTSVFKVAGTGLATIAGQGSGGASVSDTGTTANTLTVANSVSTGFTGAVLSLNAVSSTTVYSLIDATVGAGSTPRFNVAATGLTTIVGSGSGGASISDSGTTTSTLSVANSITSGFTGALLSMNAVSTTKLYTLIDAQSSGVSRFKVAATGLTTIVGSGGGGASISDAGTTTNTLIVANSISTGFTGTLLSMNAVSTTTSYTLIDAQSSGTSKFTVAASGLTTIASGGLTVTTGGVTIGAGGLVVSAGGATVTAGGLTVSAGGASISDNQATVNTLSVANSITSGFTGALLSMNAVSSTTAYTLIDAKSSGTSRFKVAASGLTTISAGGLSVTGGVTVVDTGLTVTTGGASLSDSGTTTNTLTVANSATTGFTGALLSMNAVSSTTAYTLIDAKSSGTSRFKVAASGLTTISAGGLSVTGGVTVVDTGLTVSAGGASIAGGATIAGGVTVSNTGLTVTTGGATITDTGTTANTLTLTNSASSFNKAILAMVSTATTGFSVIDAKVGSTSVFNVAPSGLTTISAGGLSVSGGATIAGGVTVSNTGLTVSGGGATIAGGVTVSNTGLTVSGGGATIAGGATITGSASISGGASITGGITAVDTGVTVTTGGARIYDTGTSAETLTVKNTASGITKALLYLDSTETSGFPLIDAKVAGTSQFTVTAAGLTAIASGGLSVKGGVTVVDTGVTVSAGVVGISDTTASTVSTDGALVVSGGVGIGGSIRCAGTSYAVTHTNTSDRRLKTAIKNLTAAQETIRRLRPVTYEWRRDEFPSRNFPTGVFPGFLADEVEQILPDLVQQDGDGWKSMDYVGIVPHLVRAVQEMQDQLEASQAQMTRMQQQIDTLQAAVAA